MNTTQPLRTRGGPWLALGLITLVLLASGWLVSRSRAPAPAAPDLGAPAPLAEVLDRTLGRRAVQGGPGLAMRTRVPAGDDPALAGLGDMWCRLLATRLANLGGLRVAACESTRAALAAGLDDAALARLLAVDHLVNGRLERRPGGRLHLQLELIELPAQRRLWQLATELSPNELQGAAQQLAQHLAGRLGLAGAPPAEPDARPEAFDKLLQAQLMVARGSPDDQRAALKLVDEALALQPELRSARVLQLSLRSTALRFPTAEERADAAAHRRLQAGLMAAADALGRELLAGDRPDPRGHAVLAQLSVQQRRWVDGFVHIDRLLAQPGADAASLRNLAHLQAMAGYRRQALELALAATRLDPLNAVNHQALAFFHALLGDDARMREHAGIAQELGDRMAVVYQGIAALRSGDWPQAEAATVEALRGAGVEHGWVGGFVHAAADPAARASAAAAISALPAPLQYGMAHFHWYLAWLGDTQRTLQAVRSNLVHPIGPWLSNLWWPEFGHLRRDPGFAQVLDNTGLPALWAQRGAPDWCERVDGARWACR